MENTVILLLGYPGVGKYTIAQELEKRIPHCKVVDNHYINNPLFNLVGEELLGGAIPQAFWDNTAKIRNVVLDTIRDFSPKHFNFVMTLFCANDAYDIPSFEAREQMVKHRGGVLIPVLLSCDSAAYKERALNPQRAERKKLTKWDILETISQEELYIPDHPNLLQIDTTNLSPAETADIILQRAQELITTKGHQTLGKSGVQHVKDPNHVPK